MNAAFREVEWIQQKKNDIKATAANNNSNISARLFDDKTKKRIKYYLKGKLTCVKITL